ncbi:Pimeloyl-ACP methyl ester carboxylesterase [Actinacidiphila yanglinensis]|uniref:Pimeloyl-ACP methyl ester carboxylesterase n=1 Tax=Actinacidiphila yanglinensis TaxID=310779 RepID=A0A1H6EBS5_9ACTN|nr:alpha/beta hydrolase [Actinacidiphila yanglinensis]SEG95288.1 Pimeloyl-ACP methyl ester carboxylesterase [Actinacidiphila yanglinensis]
MQLRLSRRVALAGAAAFTLFAAAMVPGVALANDSKSGPPKPTVVLVHGAWADSSSWDAVMTRLRADGYPVRAIADPLQGLTSDSAYLSSYLATIKGPVVLVGHSYGGAVITNAATSDPDVKSLVYIAGFIPVTGETVGDLAGRTSPSLPLVYTPVPGGTEVSIDPAHFREAFAGDVDADTAANLAAAQRPANTRAVTDPSVGEAFRTIPSWDLITLQDHAIAPDVQRFMAARAHAHVSEVKAAHAVMVSRPGAVTKIIEQAAR